MSSPSKELDLDDLRDEKKEIQSQQEREKSEDDATEPRDSLEWPATPLPLQREKDQVQDEPSYRRRVHRRLPCREA